MEKPSTRFILLVLVLFLACSQGSFAQHSATNTAGVYTTIVTPVQLLKVADAGFEKPDQTAPVRTEGRMGKMQDWSVAGAGLTAERGAGGKTCFTVRGEPCYVISIVVPGSTAIDYASLHSKPVQKARSIPGVSTSSILNINGEQTLYVSGLSDIMLIHN